MIRHALECSSSLWTDAGRTTQPSLNVRWGLRSCQSPDSPPEMANFQEKEHGTPPIHHTSACDTHLMAHMPCLTVLMFAGPFLGSAAAPIPGGRAWQTTNTHHTTACDSHLTAHLKCPVSCRALSWSYCGGSTWRSAWRITSTSRTVSWKLQMTAAWGCKMS